MKQGATQSFAKKRLLAMMALRLFLALAFLGVISWRHFTVSSPGGLDFYPTYFFAATIGVLTLIYALLFRRLVNIRLFTCVQIIVDNILLGAVIFVTGGAESYLIILYYLSVIGSTTFLNRLGGIFAAALSSLSFIFVIMLDYYGSFLLKYKVVSVGSAPLWGDTASTLTTNIFAFFTVAYLTGYLTERTARVEKELEETAEDLDRLEDINREIVGNIHSGIMTLDIRGRITSFNRAAQEITGYRLKEVYDRRADEVLDGLDKDKLSITSSKFRRGGESIKVKGGEERYLGFSVSKGAGEDMSTIVIFQDLTKLKSMEEQLIRDDKLKALGELAAGMAHEVRNPLASISGSIQVLREGSGMGEDDRRLMDIVLRETERLNALITDFLLFAKPVKEKTVDLSLSNLLTETIELFTNSPEASKLRILHEIGEDIHINGNRRQLEQVFWNLFLNATEAMDSGGELHITLNPSNPDEAIRSFDGESSFTDLAPGKTQAFEIKVRDTGTGIPSEDMDKIFDPFYSTKETGTGLGLSIIHRIVESHGGFIDIESSGAGTTVRLIFPGYRRSSADAGRKVG